LYKEDIDFEKGLILTIAFDFGGTNVAEEMIKERLVFGDGRIA
jgi:hypothetical protein